MTKAKRNLILIAGAGVVVALGITLWYKLLRPVPYTPPNGLEARFKYGLPERQIGPEVPYWVWQALPRSFPNHLPTPGGYKALGVAWELGEEFPVGFAQRTVGYPRVSVTCGMCHTTTYRLAPADTPKLAMLLAGKSWKAEGYRKFLRDAANDEKFTAKEILAQIGYLYPLSTLEKLLYRLWIIPSTRRALRADSTESPHAFTEYDRKERGDWLLKVSSPKFPFSVDQTKIERGNQLYAQHCATCHEPGMPKFGAVIDIAELKTDPVGLDTWTKDDENAVRIAIESRGGKVSETATKGYFAVPLEGLWLRAPYLHNGSVPTLRDLLKPEKERPILFYRAYDVYDGASVGFVSEGSEATREGIRFETGAAGNSNLGHLYGTDLPEDDKTALIEFLKTF